MKRYLAATVLLIVFLSVLIPFASSNPDGLEKVAASLGVEPQPIWSGFMPDYSVEAFNNPYASTLAAGILGTIIVLSAASILGYTITKRSTSTSRKR
ncbi:MAG TPA: PDGLE domain-containing protein [Candidatus Bathyarchaeia archaeon]|nr:PDGLE domain-containing protein [Candidatus Bathyarchaeia archaeon]